MIRGIIVLGAACLLGACATAPKQGDSLASVEFLQSARYQNYLRHMKQYPNHDTHGGVIVSPVGPDSDKRQQNYLLRSMAQNEIIDQMDCDNGVSRACH